MGASFIRRFLIDPGNNVLLNIESVDILDLTPPSSISGVGTGVVLVVGEFEDGAYNAPTQVSGATDLVNSYGNLGFTYNGVQGNFPCAVARKADNTLSPEYWNGNAMVQLSGKQFSQLLVCRVDTHVGNIQLTQNAYVTGSAEFRYPLAAGQVLGLDIGNGPQTATFTATAGTVTSSTGTYASINPGDTVTLGYDGAFNFTVTFLAGDTTQANVIARINQYAGFTMAATVSGTTFSLTGRQLGTQGNVKVVSASSGGVLTNLGLTVATTFGTGNVANILAVTPGEIASIIQAAITSTRVETDQNGAIRISNTLGTASSYILVTSATTAVNLGFVAGQMDTYGGNAVVVSTASTYPSTTAGTFLMQVDGGTPFTVTLTSSNTLAAVVAAINTGAGKTVAFADSTTQFYIVGTAVGGAINIISASAGAVLTSIGLTVGSTVGSGLPSGNIPAGTVVQDTNATHVFVTTQSVVFSPTGVTIGGNLVSSTGPWLVPIRHAVDDGTGTSSTAGNLTVLPTPPLNVSLTAVNLSTTSNALTEPAIDAAYVNAMNATLDLNSVARQANIMYSARQSNTVRKALRTTVLSASANGMFGRVTAIRTPLGTTRQAALSISAEPGVGAYRDQRVIYCFPQVNTFVPIIGTRGVAGGQGFTASGNVDVGADGFLASILSQLPPEENPGQETTFTSAANGLETSANAQGYQIQDYISFKGAGICSPRMDNGVLIFQSGVTSVDPNVYPSLVRISRRRIADFIQDSLALLLTGYGKQLSTVNRRNAIVSAIRNFMEQLLSKNNPSSQRIGGYGIDAKSGNTPDTLALGIFRIILNVQTLPSLDAIVLQTDIGEDVTNVTEVLPQAA